MGKIPLSLRIDEDLKNELEYLSYRLSAEKKMKITFTSLIEESLEDLLLKYNNLENKK